jgi:hypothetical protein
MTKSQQIMSLYDGKRTTKEIAEIVGCLPAYVRVIRQRASGLDHNDTYQRRLVAQGDRDAARRAAREAHKLGRNRGSAYRKVMLVTGREALRRQETSP